MDNNFAIRLISSAGFSRIEVPMNSTFLDLKREIFKTVNVHVKEQKLFYDMKQKSPISFPDNTPVSKLNLK
jgi:hypothetical protein